MTDIYFTKSIEKNNPDLADEIDIHIRSLKQDLKKHFGIKLLADDRGVVAYEAVCKWVAESILEEVKE
tara:strand:+ start:540 stop:743 length:204 start_codon:yes stop_codon:yes gene_type:complete